MSSPKPLVAVTGATGAQGGSVVKFLLKDGGFRIRGITRNPGSAAAQKLAAQGVEVVRGDFEEPASIAAAFKGAHAVFGVTNYWDLGSENAGEKEEKQGKMLVDAAKAAGVKHFIWSTLDHTTTKTEHWDSKARVNDYLIASGLPRTSLYTSFYFENLVNFPFMKVAKAEDGALEVNWPIMATDGPIGVYAVADTGAWVLESLKHPEKWINKDLRVVAEIITPREIVKTFEELSGKSIKLHEITMDAFETLKGGPFNELYTNNKWFYINNGNPNRDPELSKSIYPEMQSFRSWAQANIAALVPQ